MSFRFRFARLKSIRELEEELAEQRLALARQEEERQALRLHQVCQVEKAALAEFAAPHQGEILELELEARYCHETTFSRLQQTEVVHQAVQQVECDRQDLLHRRQKVEVMQSLHDRHREQFLYEDSLAEQKVLDELGSMQYMRQAKKGR
ncbi:MAG: flagellar export protein FliJ [Symbiobacteriaceae bacterium]|nr:flagellar export protein FliJ [Symbiobacteriaceae bacterium]